MKLTKEFQSILWEYNINNFQIDEDIVIIRALWLWDKNYTDFLIKNIGKEKMKEVFLKNYQELDPKSVNYWAIMFDIDKSTLKLTYSIYDKLNKPIFTRNFE